MKPQIYNKPKYYEIAFSFVGAKKQVELFEKFIKKYSKIKVKKVLDIACGPALQLREFVQKIYNSKKLFNNMIKINNPHPNFSSTLFRKTSHILNVK